MKKYIDRDEFVKRLNENVELTNPEEQEWVKDECIRQAHAMPSVNVSGWISVEERLPKPFVSVLVYMPEETPHPTVHEGFVNKRGEWYAGGYDRLPDEVVAWMDMPEPPKGE